jgi:hypothetical protein
MDGRENILGLHGNYTGAWIDLEDDQLGLQSVDSPPNSTMQKEDSPSHQNVGKYMEY